MPKINTPKISEILETMDYGPSPEASDHVRDWLKAHEAGFGHFIDGGFTEPAEGGTFEVRDPAHDRLLARVAEGTQADVDAIRARNLPADTRLSALSHLARRLIETRGHVPAHDLEGFITAGFTQAQSLEILAVIAASTITNYAGTIAQPPMEDFLQPHVWRAMWTAPTQSSHMILVCRGA